MEGLTLLEADDVNDRTTRDRLLALSPDIGVSVDFGQKIGTALLEGIPQGLLNIHPSLLPKCRGAAPVNWTIIRGQEKTGVTVFRMVEEMDAGPILAVRETLIGPEETAEDLSARLAGIGCDALDAALQRIDCPDPPLGEPQDHAQATSAPKLTKARGRIGPDRPAREVARWINGLHPWPGVQWTYHPADERKPIRVRPARAVPVQAATHGSASSEPGTVLPDESVACREGAVSVLEVQPSGSRQMAWRDFVNGRRVRAGDRFTVA